MNNIKLTIEYHGLPYCGWQYQKNEKTVQGEIEKAIFKFSGEKKTIQVRRPHFLFLGFWMISSIPRRKQETQHVVSLAILRVKFTTILEPTS